MTGIRRIVIVVFDGLRPDMIDPAMPRLRAFADAGLEFTAARSVFPSVTRVATTSLATGAWPGSHGIVNNAFHMPQVLKGRALDTSDFTHLSLMRSSLPAVVTCESLGRALAFAGLRMGTVHCGSAGSAYLVNHDVARNDHWTFSIHGEAASQTPEAVSRGVARCGPLPPQDVPKLATVHYAQRALRALALEEDGPEVSLLWLPEPDTTYHQHGLGAPGAVEVLAAVDLAFSRVVDHIRSLPDSDETAIFALSDHGQISTTELVELDAEMRASGLRARTHPDTGDALAVTRGRSGEIRCLTGDSGLVAAASDWLMSRPDVGMVFARGDHAARLPGTLPLASVHLDHPRAPDLMYVMRDDTAPDGWGLPGRGAYTGGVAPGGGMHGGLNRHEMHTVMICDVPGARRGSDDTPTGLIDLAPTILSLLGRQPLGQGLPLPLFEAPREVPNHRATEARRPGFAQRLHLTDHRGRTLINHGGRASSGNSAAELSEPERQSTV